LVLPIRGLSTAFENLIRDAVLRKELESLTTDQQDFERFRLYYDGDQPLAFATDYFKQVFGSAFEGFKDNWCRPIVGAVLDKMTIEGISVDERADDMEANIEVAQKVWDVFRDNEFEETQYELHEGVLVESRAYAIVWPDPLIGATIDWQPAGLVRIRYDSEARRKKKWAVKRWQTEDGDVYVTIYTDRAVFKFIQKEGSDADIKTSSPSPLDEIPDDFPHISGLEIRTVDGEPWPLPHKFGEVPVVEFNNTSWRSEIKDTIPQQDALNKTLLDMLVAGEFAAVPQRIINTLGSEPVGGWESGGGRVWHLKPGTDAEGKIIPATWGTFEAADLNNFIKPVEMWLSHIAYTSSTPVDRFLSSDRGGRGDAPSGESKLVGEMPLNKKVLRKQRSFGNRHMNLARLVAKAIEADPDALKRGAPTWQDPRYEFRAAVLDEAIKMRDLGLPLEYIVGELGLSETEKARVLELVEAEKEEEEAKAQQDFDQQMEMQKAGAAAREATQAGSGTGSGE
jgi:hypothetical protein